MNAKVKRYLLLATAAVLIYTLVVHPTQLGDGVQTVLGWVGDGFDSIVAFLRSATD